MLVTLERKSYKFMECKSGLYYYDNEYLEICDKVEVTEVDNNDKTPVNDYSRLKTVKDNNIFFDTERDCGHEQGKELPHASGVAAPTHFHSIRVK